LWENGCAWDPTTTQYAAEEGHLECLKYAHKNLCAWGSVTNHAAKKGQLLCMEYSHFQIGCHWNITTSANAALGGHLDCLRYLHEHGCEWSSFTCEAAAQYGHIECLKYAHQNGMFLLIFLLLMNANVFGKDVI
jgi:hypothetical protein